MQPSSRGFTLLELSIVLAIIGLLVAGITSGVSILRDSHLKRVMTDAENFRGIISLFKNRYNALPGDFARAGALWGNDCNGSSSGSDTCSGNGNRIIQHGAQDALSTTSESLRLWQHLKNADMFNASLTGLPASGCSDPDNICAAIDQNIPAAPANNSGYYLYTDSSTRNTVLIVGGTDNSTWNDLPVFSPLEAYEIDEKIDDGINSTGNFSGTGILNGTASWALSMQNATTNCYNASLSTAYNTAADDKTCGAVFLMGQSL